MCAFFFCGVLQDVLGYGRGPRLLNCAHHTSKTSVLRRRSGTVLGFILEALERLVVEHWGFNHEHSCIP